MGNDASKLKPSPTLVQSDTDSILLSQTMERLQSVDIGASKIILSIEDDLPVGMGTNIDDESAIDTVYIYAEQLTISESFLLNNAIISTHELNSVNTSPALLDLHGNMGSIPNPPVNTALPPLAGGNGANGGSLYLYVENVLPGSQSFMINAAGGQGSQGQAGTDSTDGGNGGDGGQGGTVTAFISHPYLRIIEQLQTIYLITDFEMKLKSLQALLTSKSATLLAPLQQEFDNADQMNTVMDQVATSLQTSVTTWSNQLQANISTLGGSYGIYGQGKSNGVNGKPGASGTSNLQIIGSLSRLSSPLPNDVFLWIHPSQCQMKLENAKLMYFTADPIHNPDGIQAAVISFKRLQERTLPFQQINQTDSLAQYWNANEHQIGATGSLTTFQGIYNESTRYINQFLQGLDYYGYPASHVPLTTFTFYQNQLNILIEQFQTIENAYLNQFSQLQTSTQTLQYITQARNQAESIIEADKDNVAQLQQMAITSAGIIDSYQAILPAKKQAVEAMITEFEDMIQSNFHVDFGQFLTALGAISFAPESVLNWSSQIGSLLYGTKTKIMDDQGNQINKNYIVSQLTTVNSDIDSIMEGYQTLDDGTLASDDPGAAKLLADQQQLETLLGNFANTLHNEVVDIEEIFQDYVNSVIARNTEILKYNAIINLLVYTQQEIEQNSAKVSQLNDNALTEMKANWPDLTAFVSKLYYAARSQIFETLYLTSRSFQFWALSDTNILAEALGNQTPPQINSDVLVAAQSSILNSYANAIEKFGTYAASFPSSSNDKGILYTLTSSQVELLKTTNEVMLKIPVAVATTSIAINPFAGKSNVRITTIRAWLNGAKTDDNEIQIYITHTGHEQITDSQNTIYTFSHDPRTAVFQYNLQTQAILEDGSIGLNDTSGTHDTIYALVGPFTYWHIVINPNYNKHLDLSQLSEVTLEFHGTNYSFMI